MGAMVPSLSFSHLRVDVGGAPAVDGLTLQSTGDHVLVLGAARAVFDAAAGLRPVSHGELLVGGMEPREAIRAGALAAAPLDPALPSAWTVLQYVTWSARLSGHERATAAELTEEALARMQLGAAAKTKLGVAPVPVRRAAVIAAALATGASTVLLDDPASPLADDSALSLARIIARAHEDRRTVVFASRVRLESPLALAADEAIVVDGREVVAQGPPAEIAAAEKTLSLRVAGNLAAFRRAIEERGGRTEVHGAAPPPCHVRVELGPLAARDLVRIAAECDALVVELRPLSRAFA